MSSKNNSKNRLNKESMSITKLNNPKPTVHRKSLVDNGLLPANWEEA